MGGEAKDDIEWPYEVDDGDHFETPFKAFSDVAPLLRFFAKARAKRKGLPVDGAAEQLRVYDPYFCTGRTCQYFRDLGFPNVINRNRDFYRDIAQKNLPKYDVLVTNPPYSAEHKGKLFDFLIERQRLAIDRAKQEPFLLLIPSWTVGKAVFSKFLQDLAKVYASRRSDTGSKVAETANDVEDTDVGVFYLCGRGRTGYPSKYNFDHVRGAGLVDCPFFGLWICGGFGDESATRRAIRKAARSDASGYWQFDGSWYPCRAKAAVPEAASQNIEVVWDDGTQSSLPQNHVAGGCMVFDSRRGLEAAGISRSAEDVRRRQEDNPKQKKRREIALQALAEQRAAARSAAGVSRKKGSKRKYVKNEATSQEDLPAKAKGACRHFFSEIGCSRGEKCRFSHVAGTDCT